MFENVKSKFKLANYGCSLKRNKILYTLFSLQYIYVCLKNYYGEVIHLLLP